MPILHSTKNLHILEPPTQTREGVGVFEYTDNYTIFHYGRMPDTIPGKGEAVCRMAVFNFQMLEAAGIPTHFRRYIEPNRIEFTLSRMMDPSTARPAPGTRNRLLPVMTIFRNELPAGSSVHQRIAVHSVRPAAIGLTEAPTVGQMLEHPMIEFATMLEATNRFLDPAQAQHLAALHDQGFQDLRDLTLRVNEVISEHARSRRLRHCDGKVEYLLSAAGTLMVADSPGTPDESRFQFKGIHCGKQIIRDWYLSHGLEIPVQQLIAAGVPRDEWTAPPPLPPAFIPVMSDLYQALSQTWTGETRWEAPDLDRATQAAMHLVKP